ncbi:hypothetical protein ACOMHN_066460 [Nucella lapillus]
MFGSQMNGCKPCPEECVYTCDNYWGCDKNVDHNVALQKEVTQSTVQRYSSFVVSGYFVSSWIGTCVVTKPGKALTVHWIRVDLGSHYAIVSTVISGRRDCCSEDYLRKFFVVVSNSTAYEPKYPPATDKTCFYYRSQAPTGASVMTRCNRPFVASVVLIVSQGVKGLAVCTLIVQGSHIYESNYNGLCKGNVQSDCRSGTICAESNGVSKCSE